MKFHDLGKLCFAFTAFWGYLTFGQYLVSWYGNLAEETHWQRLRLDRSRGCRSTWRWCFSCSCSRSSDSCRARRRCICRRSFAFALASLIGLWLLRYIEVYPSLHSASPHRSRSAFGRSASRSDSSGIWGASYAAFMNAFPRMRVMLMTSQFRDEVQVPVNPETMEPLPAHE